MPADRHSLAAVSVLVCLGLIPTGCGGGDDSGSEGEKATTSQTTEATTSSRGDDAEGVGASDSVSEDDGDSTASTEPPPSKPVQKTGSPPKVKGGDNSIQNFGDEADPAAAEEIAGVLAGYLSAQADREFRRACQYLSAGFDQQLQMFAEQANAEVEITCESFLKQGVRRLPAKERKIMADIRVGSVRVDGDRGFVIYKDGRNTWQAIPMSREGDSWRVGGLTATPLPV